MGSIAIGDWTTTPPSGTLVHDSGNTTTYPPLFHIDPAENGPLFSGVAPMMSDGSVLGTSNQTISYESSFSTKDASGNDQNMLRILGSALPGGLTGDSVVLGNALPLLIRGSYCIFNTTTALIAKNGVPYKGWNLAGNASLQIGRINSSNDAELGDSSAGLRLLGDETRPQYNGGDLALSADLSSYSLTTHDHSGTYPPITLWGAKGTLVAASAISTPAAVPVGTNEYVLMADSAQAAGVKWSSIGTNSLANNAVTYAKFQDMPQATLLGRPSGAGTGDPQPLSGSEITLVGTGDYGVSTTITVSDHNASGVFQGRHTLTFVNGWLTAQSFSSAT